jgi:hypothetical protein
MPLLIRIWSVFSLFDFVAIQALITKVTIVATILISHTCIPNYSFIRTNQILPSKVASVLAVDRGCRSTFI